MAKVRNNLVLHGLSGMIGKQLVIRKQKDGDYIVCSAPNAEGHEATPKQKQQQELFRKAMLYAKSAKNKPEYGPIAKSRGVSTFNVAAADFFHPPEITDIDLSAYSGASGETITIKAVDDVKVTTVGVLLTDDNNVLIEKGKAMMSPQDPHVWTYDTTAAAPSASVKVFIDVADLAGHVTEQMKHT
ncbi:MAG: hypothetical protein U0359_39945 [Byssovorax sp.]